MRQTTSARIRADLPHPVIDCDAHWLQPTDIFLDYARKIGGSHTADAWLARRSSVETWYGLTERQRRTQRVARAPYWTWPTDTLDRATAMSPALLARRLPDFGLDFSIVIPSNSIGGVMVPEADLRRKLVRALNTMQSDMFGQHQAALTACAVIPTYTPEEAIEEAEYCATELGFKAVVIHGTRVVQMGSGEGSHPATFIDTLGLDNEHDFDALWKRLTELRLVPLTHSPSSGWPDRSSPSNFVNNTVGHFGQAANALTRSLFLGGVVRRFPTVKFAMLECGVGSARVLLSSLVSIFEKRNQAALLRHLQPSNLDLAELRRLLRHHDPSWYLDGDGSFDADIAHPGKTLEELTAREPDINDFRAAGIESVEELNAEFARNFYFGCEADDPLVALAFDQRFGPELKAILGSDISHWDVPDMTTILSEAFELVEHGLLDAGQFRSFTFGNAVDLLCGTNPDFFKGTALADAVRDELPADH